MRGSKMKVEMTNYGAVFNLHCPRCGKDEWSDKIYDIGKNKYRKCMNCGSDVCTNEHTRVGIVVENRFIEFTPMTYDEIENELRSSAWKREPPAPMPQYERD
jgi:transcription elongation factor Elf1